jgi:hypothetical protein
MLNGESSPANCKSVNSESCPPSPKLRITKRGTIRAEDQATHIQRLTFDSLQSMKIALTGEDGQLKVTRDDAVAMAQLVRAWDTARDAVRILRGKGLPAAVKSKPSKSSPPAEPILPG